VVSLVHYLWKSFTKVVWCCPISPCQLSVAVVVAIAVVVALAVTFAVTFAVTVAVAITSCANSVVQYISILMCLSCTSSMVTQLSTLARV
jgi:hypothetical protein